MNATVVAPEVRTLDAAAAEVDLFNRVADALRGLETSDAVRKVIVSPAHGVLVVIGHDYDHIALKVVAT